MQKAKPKQGRPIVESRDDCSEIYDGEDQSSIIPDEDIEYIEECFQSVNSSNIKEGIIIEANSELEDSNEISRRNKSNHLQDYKVNNYHTLPNAKQQQNKLEGFNNEYYVEHLKENNKLNSKEKERSKVSVGDKFKLNIQSRDLDSKTFYSY